MDHNQAGGQKAAESINFGDLMKAEGKRRLDENSGEKCLWKMKSRVLKERNLNISQKSKNELYLIVYPSIYTREEEVFPCPPLYAPWPGKIM